MSVCAGRAEGLEGGPLGPPSGVWGQRPRIFFFRDDIFPGRHITMMTYFQDDIFLGPHDI
jgi:hypothetical protein